jgi:hypothetical protein
MTLGIKICEECHTVYSEHTHLTVCPHPLRRAVEENHDEAIKKLFHELWNHSIESPGYRWEIRRKWDELWRHLQARGIDI